jgi:hypothetical protein
MHGRRWCTGSSRWWRWHHSNKHSTANKSSPQGFKEVHQGRPQGVYSEQHMEDMASWAAKQHQDQAHAGDVWVSFRTCSLAQRRCSMINSRCRWPHMSEKKLCEIGRAVLKGIMRYIWSRQAGQHKVAGVTSPAQLQ